MTERLQDSRRREHQFIADAAHELRTPVALLQGTLEMMIDGIYPPDRQRLEQLHGESQRLGRLVADMQDLSRADAGGLELCLSRTKIGGVLEGSRNALRRRREEGTGFGWKSEACQRKK